MIVELFGPPGAGKTTFAHTVAERMRSDGRKVDLKLSYRPGEQIRAIMRDAQQSERGQFCLTAHRLARPAIELLSVAGSTEGTRRGTAALASMLPRGGIFRSLRLRQYLRRLSNAWFEASKSCDIAIFDQAFVQAILSLLIIHPDISEKEIVAVIDAIPQSDLIVRVDASVRQIEGRLDRRVQSLGLVGRLLEEKHGRVSDQIHAADRLNELLVGSGRTLLCVRSTDDFSFAGAINEAESEILRIFRVSRSSSMASAAPHEDLQWPIENSNFG